MDKLNKLNKVSNINEVNRKAHDLNLNEVHPSSQARYKYMIFDGNKMVHFGDIKYQDFTKHKDQKRLENFRNRNRRFKNSPVYSAAFLSYNLLW